MKATNTREALANLLTLQTAQAEGMDSIGVYVEKAFGVKMSEEEEKAKSINCEKGLLNMFVYIVSLHDNETIQTICKHSSLTDMLDCNVLRHEGMSLDDSAKIIDNYLAVKTLEVENGVEPFVLLTNTFTFEEMEDSRGFEMFLIDKSYAIKEKMAPKEFLELGIEYLKEYLTTKLEYSVEEVEVINDNIGLYFADAVSGQFAYTEVIKTLEGNRNG